MRGIKITSPKRYEQVGSSFSITGWVSTSWLRNGFGVNERLSLDLIDIDGQTFMGMSVGVVSTESWIVKFLKKKRISGEVTFGPMNGDFIVKSEGRITLRISGHKKNQDIFLPIIVRNKNPNFIPNSEIVKKHKKVGKMIIQYEKDLEVYYKRLEMIRKNRQEKNYISEEDASKYHYVNDFELIGSFLDLLGSTTQEVNKDYPFIDEDLEERMLEEKFKDALEWRGPLFGGVVGYMNGFEFRVHSHDHDRHLHIIHKGRGINARFSFPEIKLINYKKARTSIRSKEEKQIIDFLKKPEIFKKLDNEFAKREQVGL